MANWFWIHFSLWPKLSKFTPLNILVNAGFCHLFTLATIWELFQSVHNSYLVYLVKTRYYLYFQKKLYSALLYLFFLYIYPGRRLLLGASMTAQFIALIIIYLHKFLSASYTGNDNLTSSRAEVERRYTNATGEIYLIWRDVYTRNRKRWANPTQTRLMFHNQGPVLAWFGCRGHSPKPNRKFCWIMVDKNSERRWEIERANQWGVARFYPVSQ